jgi:hypothetical protein
MPLDGRLSDSTKTSAAYQTQQSPDFRFKLRDHYIQKAISFHP